MRLIIGSLDFHPDDAEQVLELTKALAKASMAEEGCLYYSFSVDNLVPGRFRVAECWINDDAITTHRASPHVAAFMAGADALRFLGMDAQQFAASDPIPVSIPES